ncbi:MAG: ADP-ribose diphosphatase [Candidatus Accumulibacter phosphatis]|uniref:ADP-ribose pyrophosphatase n=1 Tax=Candidatus Accumulibacter phosphatis TaxID=327160 RepID=A0A6A7RXN5_9PROT|nr:ADP-ribose diphosphatase [Candidatus Accumulibacter phosphatis]
MACVTGSFSCDMAAILSREHPAAPDLTTAAWSARKRSGRTAAAVVLLPEFIHNGQMPSKPSKPMKASILHIDAAYRGFFELRRLTVEHDLFDGGSSGPLLREVLHRSDVAAALLYDASTDKVVLVEQYRAGAHLAGENPWLIDIVAGRIEAGQTPLDTIRREIAEESGLTPTAIVPIGVYLTAPHLSSERVHLYCAAVDAGSVAGCHGLAHETEDIRPLVLARSEALAAMRTQPLSLWAGLALAWLGNEQRIPPLPQPLPGEG